MSGLRTAAACFNSAVRALSEPLPVERPLDLADLVGEEVRAVEPCAYGVRIRFGSGRTIAFPAGVAIDGAGLAVIEP